MAEAVIIMVLVVSGVATACFAINTVMSLHETVEERAAALLRHVYMDLAMLIILLFTGLASAAMIFFLPKYIFLAIIDFQRTFEQ